MPQLVLEIGTFGHMGDGNLHPTFLTDERNTDEMRRVHEAFKEIFGTARFEALRKRGARVQRPLWGSTSTKNPAYPDLLYVEPLIGPDTVNTVPPQTYTAILDHARPSNKVEDGLDESGKVLANLKAEGVDMKWVLQKLEDDGVAAFEKSFNGLYENLNRKRGELVDASLPS